MPASPELLSRLRERGATGLTRVTLRNNRSTIWSLTAGGRTLNLHAAFADAPEEILGALATIVRDAARRGSAWRSASENVRAWPPVLEAIGAARGRAREKGLHRARHCCGTSEQIEFLERLYRYLNATRFESRLPDRVPLRLSNRMRSRLGQMEPGRDGDRRIVREIALNVDLLLRGNGKLRVDTLLHEMAHAADWVVDGEVGHGSTWRAWADRAGCQARACLTGRIRRRRRGTRTVTRVPRLPAEVLRWEQD